MVCDGGCCEMGFDEALLTDTPGHASLKHSRCLTYCMSVYEAIIP
jgi:hypothetical protein